MSRSSKDLKHGLSLVRRMAPEISWHHAPSISPGEYPAYSRKAQIYFDRQFKRWVCAVQFDILSEDRLEVIAQLTWYLNLGSGEKARAGRRGSYWQAWSAANGGPPKRGDRLAPRVFDRRHAIVAVDDTTKNFRQMAIASEESYSVVRGVVRWETGGME